MTNETHAASEEIPLQPNMNREQTVQFLRLHHVRSLGIDSRTYEKFQAHRPVLYVFQDSLPARAFELKPFIRRPSLARIDDPVELKFGGYLLTRGQIDYYAIDPSTQEVFLIKTGGARAQYEIGIPYLFEPCDRLFPKGPGS